MKKFLFLLGVAVAFIFLSQGYFLAPEAKAETLCLIRFSVFDNKIYDPVVAEGLLIKENLISKGALVTAIKDGKLPFDSSAKDSKIVEATFNELEIQLCGKVGTCDKKTLDMQIVCESGGLTGNTVNDAQLAYNSRIASMNTCQRQIFTEIQAKNNLYLQAVRTANVHYYQQLAPLTANLLKVYRYSKDGDKSKILNDYITENKNMRKTLYKSQTATFDKFIRDRIALQTSFDSCK
jgi:hypothetical protein